jgi:hypothetical protein
MYEYISSANPKYINDNIKVWLYTWQGVLHTLADIYKQRSYLWNYEALDRLLFGSYETSPII